MSKNHHLTADSLRKAVENRDSKSLKGFYAPEAEILIIDQDNPPSRPRKIIGAKDIGDFLDDVYSREMTHKLDSCVREGTELAFVEGCKYPDGTRVVASCTAHVGPKGIARQTVVQAWDA